MDSRLLLKTIWFHLTNFRTWVHGIAAASVGGSSTTLAAHFADPTHIDFTPNGLHAIWKVALSGALVTMAAYLIKSPLPSYCQPTALIVKP